MVTGQVAQKSSRPKLCRSKIIVMSPEMSSYVARCCSVCNNSFKMKEARVLLVFIEIKFSIKHMSNYDWLRFFLYLSISISLPKLVLLKPSYIARAGDRLRQRHRPEDPVD